MENFSKDHMLKKAKMHILKGELSQANAIYEGILESATHDGNILTSLTPNVAPVGTQLCEPSDGIIERLIGLYNSGEVRMILQEANELVHQYPENYIIWNLIGGSYLQIGQVDQAIHAFLRVVEINPSYEQGYNNLGVAYSNKGDLDHAIDALRKAISINGGYTEALNNLGQAFMENGDFYDAITCYKKAISNNPNSYEAYYNLGLTYKAIEEWMLGSEVLRIAIGLKPQAAEAYNDLGICFRELNKPEDAILSYRKAIELQPNFVKAHNNLGVALKELGELSEARNTLKIAIAIDPNFPELHNTLGTVLRAQGEVEEALKHYEQAVLLDPEYVEAINNIGVLFQDSGDFEKALGYVKDAIAIDPAYTEAIYNLGAVLADLGMFEQAIEAYDTALIAKPNFAAAKVNLGRLQWRKRNFTAAFELMDWRWDLNSKDLVFGTKFDSKHPTWTGEEGADVFVWKEQGIGDEIMFSSTLTEMNEKSGKLIVECDKRLIPLYERSFPSEITFIDNRFLVNEADYDNHIAVGSLPKYFRHGLEDFGGVSSGWLKADPERVDYLRGKLSTGECDKIIGISWFTNSSRKQSSKRNILLESLMSYLKHVPAKFVSLQYGDTHEEIEKLSKDQGIELNIVDEIDLYNDIDGLAALISACDIVISIDNLTVHLAGALGIDTRVLLPMIPDVRWGEAGSDSYWYDHLTLYRQNKKSVWEEPVKDLIADITR